MTLTWFGDPVEIVSYFTDPDVGLCAHIILTSSGAVMLVPASSLRIETAS